MKVYPNPNNKTELIVKPETLLGYLILLGIGPEAHTEEALKKAELVGQLPLPTVGHLIKMESGEWAVVFDSSVDFVEVGVTIE